MATTIKLSQEELSAIKAVNGYHVWSENVKRKKRLKENIILKSTDKVRDQAMLECIADNKELLERYNNLVNIASDYHKLKGIITESLEVDNGQV